MRMPDFVRLDFKLPMLANRVMKLPPLRDTSDVAVWSFRDGVERGGGLSIDLLLSILLDFPKLAIRIIVREANPLVYPQASKLTIQGDFFATQCSNNTRMVTNHS